RAGLSWFLVPHLRPPGGVESELTQALSSHGITTTAIPPATLASDGVLSMPVIGGQVARPGLYGELALGGGVKFTKGTHSLALRRLGGRQGRRGPVPHARAPGE